MNIQVNESLSMELLREEHAQELYALTNLNREYLREWLPWLDLTKTAKDTLNFIVSAEEQYKSGGAPQYALKYRGKVCGVAGYHKIDKLNRIGSIGYWLGEEYCGKGIMTSSVQALLSIGYKNYSLHKIEIHCAEENTRSRAIPERLGFTYEATLRDCEWLYTRYVNHAVYSLLSCEKSA